jgi:hypothetical protein
MAAQRKLIRYIKLEDVVISPIVGLHKSHLEMISKLKKTVETNKDLIIRYGVTLDRNSLETRDSLLSYFAEHSTERLFLHLYGSGTVFMFWSLGIRS